jgi:hypothetical protein
MMMRYLWFAFIALFAANVMAAHKDYTFFLDPEDRLCIETDKSIFVLFGLDDVGKSCAGRAPSVSIRIIDAPTDSKFHDW